MPRPTLQESIEYHRAEAKAARRAGNGTVARWHTGQMQRMLRLEARARALGRA